MTVRPDYRLASGERVPSVTTIIGRFKAADGLLRWANEAGLQGLTLDQARQPAADAGTIAHALVEAHVHGQPEPSIEAAPEVEAQARQAFAMFLGWQEQTHMRVIGTEIALVSETHRFGGRIDAVCAMDGSNALFLADWKSANKLYADNLLQLAAYKILWEETHPDQPIAGVHLCRFSRQNADFTHAYFEGLEWEQQTFLRMRDLYDLVKTVEKRLR